MEAQRSHHRKDLQQGAWRGRGGQWTARPPPPRPPASRPPGSYALCVPSLPGRSGSEAGDSWKRLPGTRTPSRSPTPRLRGVQGPPRPIPPPSGTLRDLSLKGPAAPDPSHWRCPVHPWLIPWSAGGRGVAEGPNERGWVVAGWGAPRPGEALGQVNADRLEFPGAAGGWVVRIWRCTQ